MKITNHHSKRLIGRPRARFGALGLLALALLAAPGSRAAPKAYAHLVLNDGRQLTAVEIVQCTASRVLVRHQGGLTSLRPELLPESVFRELRLPGRPLARSLADQPAVPPLAEKVAVAATEDPAFLSLAEKVAVPGPGDSVEATLADRVASAPPEHAPAVARMEAAGDSAAGAAVGDVPMAQHRGRHRWSTCAGWMAVTLPSGETRLLANAEVSAYPAELLARHLVQEEAKSMDLAQQLRAQAVLAQQEGRTAAGAALDARAVKTASVFINSLPAAPFTTRTDASGRFNLRHDLRDVRLVATARIALPQGECTYLWIGVALDHDCLLTEANATIVSTSGVVDSRLAAR